MDKYMDRQAAHILIHSSDVKPVTHKLHSCYCDIHDGMMIKKKAKKSEVVTAQLQASRICISKCTFIMYLH